MSQERTQIRSFRVVFDLERRIHSIDRFRIPLPYGLPLRSVAYFVAALLAVLTITRLPGLGALVQPLPVPARFVVLPMVIATLLTQLRVDGRCAHDAAIAWLGWRLELRKHPSVESAVHYLADVLCVPDERSPRYRPARVDGPMAGLLRLPFDGNARGRTLVVDPRTGEAMWDGTRFDLDDRHRIRLR